ncbi:MAG: PAS domain S-box protein [Fidelibacterota bacterium]
MKKICQAIVTIPHYNRAYIGEFDKAAQCFRILAYGGFGKKLLKQVDQLVGFSTIGAELVLSYQDNLGVRAVGERKILTSTDFHEITRPLVGKRATHALSKLLNISSYAAIPLYAGDDLVGGMLVTSKEPGISAEQQESLQTFAHAAALAIQRARETETLRRTSAIVESSGEAIATSTPDGIVQTWNPEAEKLFGYTAEDVIGRSVGVLVPPDRVEEMTSLLDRLAEGKSIRGVETRRIRKDGMAIDVSLTLTPLRDRGGKLSAVCAVIRDITEQKRAEQALAESHRELELLDDIREASLKGESLGEVLKKVVQAFRELCHTRVLAFYVYDEEHNRLVPQNLGLDKAAARRIEKLTGTDIMNHAPRLKPGYRHHDVLKTGEGFTCSDPDEIVAIFREFTDSETSRKFIRPVMKLLGVRELGILPLTSREGPVGVISWVSETEIASKKMDRLKRFAGEISSTVTRVKAEEIARHQREDLKLLDDINTAASKGKNLNAILQLTLNRLRRQFRCVVSLVYLVDEEGESLLPILFAVTGKTREAIKTVIGNELSPFEMSLKKKTLINEILTDRRPRAVNDRATNLRIARVHTDAKHIRKLMPEIFDLLGKPSVLYVPLVCQEKVLGLLCLLRGEDFTSSEQRRVATLAESLSLRIHRKLLQDERDKLLGEAQRRFEQLRTVSQAALALHGGTDLERALEEILEIILGAVGLNIGWVAIRDREKGSFRLVAEQGLKAVLSKKEREGFTRGDCQCWRMAEAGELTEAENVIRCERAERCKSLEGTVNVHCSLPIILQNRVEGIINLSTDEWKPLPDETLETLRNILHEVAIAVGRALLQEEKQRTMRELEESEKRYRGLVQEAPIGIGVLGDGKWVMVNKAALKFLGYRKEEELLGKPALDVVHPDSRESAAARIQEMARTGKPAPQAEEKLMKKNGTATPALISAVPITYHGKPAFQVAALDISGLKKAQDEITKHHALLQAQQESTIDGILVIDPKGSVISYSHRFLDIWNIPRDLAESGSDDELLEYVVDQLVDPDEFLRKVEHLYKHPDEESLGDIIEFKDGRVLSRNSVPVKDSEGRVYGRMWQFRDVTDQREKEKLETALYAIAEATNAAESLDELYSSIHDIVKEFMPAENFYLALYDAEIDRVTWPYYSDPYSSEGARRGRIAGKGLTEYVAKRGESFLLSNRDITELSEKGEVTVYGKLPVRWIGVPLKVEDQTIGVLGVQTYSGKVVLTSDHLRVLEFVSTEVAHAISRKRAEEQLAQRLEDLEKFQKLTVDRELKMAKLKEEIEELKEELRQARKGAQSRLGDKPS